MTSLGEVSVVASMRLPYPAGHVPIAERPRRGVDRDCIAPSWVRHHRAVPATMALLAAYVLLWRVIPNGHGVLTGLVLIAFFRITGLSWRPAGVAAVMMATVLQLLFERGLGVRF